MDILIALGHAGYDLDKRMAELVPGESTGQVTQARLNHDPSHYPFKLTKIMLSCFCGNLSSVKLYSLLKVCLLR